MEREAFRIVAIRRVDTVAEVRQQLMRLIEEGRLRPGDKLPSEPELARLLGTSRASLREAIRTLRLLGRVEVRPGKGTFVRDLARDPITALILAEMPPSLDLIEQLIDVRAAVDVKVAELAAERSTPEDVRHLRRVLEENERTHLADPEVGSLSLAFEAALARVARNPLLARFQRVVHDLWLEAWGGLGIAPATKHMFHTEHLEVLRRIEARDVRGAAEAMRRHVDRKLAETSWQQIIADQRRRSR
jgi:GntR family transcriptional repressor for pyruvate dehydrogenase complex